MPGKPAGLPSGVRITDRLSLSILLARFPGELIDEILSYTGRQSRRQRQLPAQLMVYYIIAMALYMEASCEEVLRCVVEGLSWVDGWVRRIRNTGRGGISLARIRLGVEVLRQLYERCVGPIATSQSRGAWYCGRRLVSMDGTVMDVADTADNDATFCRPGSGRGHSGYPQLRIVCLAETGTHVLFGAEVGSCQQAERTLARKVVRHLQAGMLCLADRGFFGFSLWQQACQSGADLLWRVSLQVVLPRLKVLPDGSYLSKIYPCPQYRNRDVRGVWVRVVDYQLEGVEQSKPAYRLVTTLLDEEETPAEELASLYQERWEIEGAFDEFKTHLRGGRVVLRSKAPDLVLQELYGLLLAHFTIRSLQHEAALKAGLDPDELSFVHTVRVVRRKLPRLLSIPPSAVAYRLPAAPG